MKIDLRFSVLLACFFLSGLAGLVYQTAWTQQFAVVFGTSELALVTVLAAYMAGLGLGAAACGRLIDRVGRPVLTYALLELGIGAGALAVPAAIAAAGRLQVAVAGGGDLPAAGSSASALFYLASSFAVLLVPTAMMGATLPLLARHAIRRDAEVGSRIGVLYTTNTAGAAAGTLAAAFVLLPGLGLGRTVLAAAAVNLLVFALATLLARRSSTDTVPPQGNKWTVERDPEPDVEPAGADRRRWILPLVLVSGAVSFTWEVLWTRLLGHLLGGSVYAFATMLATFLAGIALGSALATRLAKSPGRARTGFAAAQVAVAALSLAAFLAVDRLPALARPAADEGFLARGAGLAAAVLLPAAIAVGATFPLAVRVLATGAAGAAAASARVYAWNTAGAIAGALAAGYLVLPALGFAGTAAVAAATSLALAAAAALVPAPRRRLLASVALAGLALVATVPLPDPQRVLRHSPLARRPASGKIAHLAVGRSATVLLLETPSQWKLTTNGLPESAIDPPWGRPGRFVIARWLSMLPLLAHPETRSLLVVGLGAGVTVEDLPASVAEIHVIELEPEVVAANRRVGALRRSDPLADPRLSLHVNDARGALRLTGRHFDAIVSQPSHPWTSGASHLFTREFFALVRDRLTPDGLFVQWMGLGFVDETLLRSLVATATGVFAHVEVYQPVPHGVLLLAAGRPFDIGATAERAIANAPGAWAELGVTDRLDVLAARVLDAEGARRFARNARMSTDYHNLFRTRSPVILHRPLATAGAGRIFAPHEPLRDRATRGDGLYLVRRLIRQGAVRRARRLAESLGDAVERDTAVGLTDLAAGRQRPGVAALRRALQLDRRAPEAIAGLLADSRHAIARGQRLPLIEAIDADPELAVVDGWRLIAAGDWRGVRRLEHRLAAVGPRQPLFSAARRLRVRWRGESGDAELADEALALLAPLLAPVPQPSDLLLRARAAAVAGRPRHALAAVEEALAGRPAGAALGREARRILDSLPATGGAESWRRRLRARVSG